MKSVWPFLTDRRLCGCRLRRERRSATSDGADNTAKRSVSQMSAREQVSDARRRLFAG
jgi:hypothetical protein